ncbi:MAG TPA: hypothetical protein VHH36_02080 [Candidatus Thermoplasmatota archaeon]|nr:hypothetical protein [Candidatus Thermoplasmatota archaeon]
MRSLALLCLAAAFLPAWAAASGAPAASDPAGDERVGWTMAFEATSPLCRDPAADVLWADARVADGALAASVRVADLAAPLVCQGLPAPATVVYQGVAIELDRGDGTGLAFVLYLDEGEWTRCFYHYVGAYERDAGRCEAGAMPADGVASWAAPLAGALPRADGSLLRYDLHGERLTATAAALTIRQPLPVCAPDEAYGCWGQTIIGLDQADPFALDVPA